MTDERFACWRDEQPDLVAAGLAAAQETATGRLTWRERRAQEQEQRERHMAWAVETGRLTIRHATGAELARLRADRERHLQEFPQDREQSEKVAAALRGNTEPEPVREPPKPKPPPAQCARDGCDGIVPRPDGKYCSRRCAGIASSRASVPEAKAEPETLTCGYCGQNFPFRTRNGQPHVFCSQACRNRGRTTATVHAMGGER